MLIIIKIFSTLQKIKLSTSPFSSFRGQSFAVLKKLI